jgi:hypothetical protein
MPTPVQQYDTPQDVLDSHTATEPSEGFVESSPTESAPETPSTSTSTSTPAPESDDPFAEWGGRDTVQQAMDLVRNLGTEDGRVAAAVEAMIQMGFDQGYIEDVFSGRGLEQPEYEPSPEDDAQQIADFFGSLGDDDVLTGNQIKDLFTRFGSLVDEHVRELLEDRVAPVESDFETQRAEEQQARVNAHVQSEMARLGITQDEAQQVFNEAQKYLSPTDMDLGHITAAMTRGKADFDALMERRATEYLSRKGAQRDSLPSNIGGHSNTGGGEAPPEPRNLKDAFAQVRRDMRGW